MSTIGERIRMLRESTGLGRTLFSRKHGLKEQTLVAVESGRRKPGFEIIEKIALAYPEYCCWMITGKLSTKVVQAKPKKLKD